MQKKLYEDYSNCSNSVFVIVNRKGYVEYANDELCNILQIKNEELVGSNLKDFFAKSEKKEADKLIKKLKQGKNEKEEYFTTELELIAKNGESRTIQGKSSYIKDENENLRYIVYSGEHITEYKKLFSEKNKIIQDLKNSQEELNLSLKNGLRILWEWNLKNDKLTLSGDYKKLGIRIKDPDNLSISSWLNKIHEDDRKEATEKIKNFISNNMESFEDEYRIKKDDESYIWIFSKTKKIKNEEGKTINVVGTFTDITGRKIIEKMIEKKQHLMNLLNEYNKALETKTTKDCRYGCTGCGINKHIERKLGGIYE